MSHELVDLRSDTVTRPTPGMRAAIASAEVGDDVFGDDPTVLRLQAVLAERLGYEAGLFCPSGTQSNLIAVMTHCQRGDEVILGQDAHMYRYEAGGAAVLGSVQPQPIANAPDGTLLLDAIRAVLKPDDAHCVRSRLLALENTFCGRVLPLDYCRSATRLAHERGLATHLDGARMFHAAVALGVGPQDVVAGFDSSSVCLSKGLGAPVGSVLLGSRDFIKAAHRHRKILGGGMRQAGVLAAAGLYALDRHVERLAEDHANAARLANGLHAIDALRVTFATNMVYVDFDPASMDALVSHLRAQGILTLPRMPMRLVTHLDVDAADTERTITAFTSFFAKH